MKKSNVPTVEVAKSLSLMALQKVAREMNVSHSMSMKKPVLLKKVIKAIDLQPSKDEQPKNLGLSVELVQSAKNVKELKMLALNQGIKLKSTAKRQDYIDALLVSIKPMPKLAVSTKPIAPKVEGSVKLETLKEGSKYSFIRAGKACKAVYVLVKKTATEAISSDDGLEWTAKILGYNVMPIA